MSWDPNRVRPQCIFPRARYHHRYDQCYFKRQPYSPGGVYIAHRLVVVQFNDLAPDYPFPGFQTPFSIWLDVVNDGFQGEWVTPNKDHFYVTWKRDTGMSQDVNGEVTLRVERVVAENLEEQANTVGRLATPNPYFIPYGLLYKWRLPDDDLPGLFWDVSGAVIPCGVDTDLDGIPGTRPT